MESKSHPRLPSVLLRPPVTLLRLKTKAVKAAAAGKQQQQQQQDEQPQDLSLKRRDQECQTEGCDKSSPPPPPPPAAPVDLPVTPGTPEGNDKLPWSQERLNQLYLRTVCRMLLQTRELFRRSSGDYPKLPISLDELFRPATTYPEGLLRNVSLHDPNSSNSQSINETFPLATADAGASADHFGQQANLTSNSTTQTNGGGDQSGIDSFLGLHSSDSEIIKDIISVLGGRDLHEVENGSIWGRTTSTAQANNDLHSNGNHTDASAGAAEEDRPINVTDYSPSEEFPNYHASPPNAVVGGAAMQLPGYSGYHYMAAAAARCSQQYAPLVNHTYAAAAAAAVASASAMSSSSNMDDLETASHTSGKSNRSKDFSFDSGSIKQDPDGAERLRQSRDERKAREIGIPFSIHDIINLPMDEFNDMLSRHELNEEQLNMCRDIRRRGKNKVAAQNCRKRKIDQIAQLETQVQEARARKMHLLDERQQLYLRRQEWRTKLSIIEEDVLISRKEDPSLFAIDFTSPNYATIRRQQQQQPVGGASANASDRAADARFQSLTSTSYHGRYVWKGSSSGGGNS